jgi:hypothetical protein
MVKGHVTYRISGAFLEFAPVTFSLPESANTKVTMEAPIVANPDESSVYLRIDIEGMATKEEALAEASAVAASVADRLVYERGGYLPTPTLQDTAFVEDGVHNLGSSIGMVCRGVMVHKLGAESVAKMVATVSQASFPGEAHLATLRAALGCDDPIGKFLCLYGILMTLAGDDQAKIDTLIELHGPTPKEPRTPRPDKPHVKETAYTRLRNEVAHRLKTRTVGAIRLEMEQRISGLTDIVRKAIAAVT